MLRSFRLIVIWLVPGGAVPLFLSLAVSLYAGLVTSLGAQTTAPLQADRVSAHPDLATATRLGGHVPGWATANGDRGRLPGTTPLRITLVLKRSDERQQAFELLLASQQDPASPDYHRWLTPQQVGNLYGPTQHDVDALVSWLAAKHLTVTEVAPSRVFVHATAPSSTLEDAFATSFHLFQVNGESRLANVTEPSLPTAFTPLVSAITGLADTPIRPMHGRPVVGSLGTAQTAAHAEFTSSSTGSHFVTPGDFAQIFDLQPIYNAGFNGAGQKIAIIGRSRVVATDISEFESQTGLAANAANTIIPPSGVDPGVTGDEDQLEATLDVGRVIGTAPGVQADLVVSGTSGGFNGIYVAAQYEVQTLLDPIMNISFGSCEVYSGASGVSLWDTLFAQAASEGISVFVSAADSGAATCDPQFAVPPAYQFRSINYICASSYATCVGATEFADTANPSLYWSATNGTGLTSALSYIPEGAWNDPVSGSLFLAESGGGGASIYVPKPIWQTGIGVPADNARDVPDMSFPGSGHDGYYACYATGGGDCANGRYEYFSGTSAAAPSMAAVTALLNQKTGSAHGNMNPLLYRIASSTPNAFHDATPASSGVTSCSTSIPSMCNNSTPGPAGLTGGLAGYALTTGYDQATGLGSLDIANFITAASITATSLAPGKLFIAAGAASIALGQSDTFTATYTSTTAGAPTGSVQFYASGTTLGTPIPLASGRASTAALPFHSAGTDLITATYSGDTTFAPASAPGILLTVTGLGSITSVSLSSSTIPVGTNATLSATVTPAAGSTTLPTGMVRFYAIANGVGSYIAAAPLVGGTATTAALNFNTVGSDTLTAYYLGDTLYSPSHSTATLYTVQKLLSTPQIVASSTQVGNGGYAQFTIGLPAVVTSSVAPSPTGTLQLYANGVALGAAFPVTANTAHQTISPAQLFATAGSYAITAIYSGDADWLTVLGIGPTVVVSSSPASYALSLSPATLAFSAGSATGNAATLTLTPAGGFQGTVTLSCNVAYNGTAALNYPPTCALASTILPIPLGTASYPEMVTINSTAPHAVKAPGQFARESQPLSAWERVASSSLLCGWTLWVLPSRRRSRSWRVLALALLSASLVGGLSGCSGGSTTNPTTLVGTTSGSYTVTVNATSNVAVAPVPSPATLALAVN